MSEPKRHHILSKAYLDNFKTADGLVPCLHKSNGASYSTSALNAGVRKDFNTVKFSDGSTDRKTIEAFYAILESDFPSKVRDLESLPVSPATYDYFVQFAVHQKMRTPRAKHTLGGLMKHFLDRGILSGEHHSFSNEEQWLLSRAKQGDSEALNQIALQVSGHYGMAIAAQLEDMGFVFLPVTGTKRLITCDDPVMIFGMTNRNGITNVSIPLPSHRRVLLFPLTSQVLLYGDTVLKNQIGIISYNKSARLDPGFVRRANQLLAIHAEELVIAQRTSIGETSKGLLKYNIVEKIESTPKINSKFSVILLECIRIIQRQLFATG